MKCSLRSRAVFAATFALLASQGCSTNEVDTGGAEITGTSANALEAADIQSVKITISGNGIGAPIVNDLTHTGARWQATIGAIPAGVERTFKAEALDSNGVVIFTGLVEHVTIERGTTVVVALHLQPLVAPVPFTNAAPKIDAFTASSDDVGWGDTVNLSLVAHDPNPGDTLTYEWSASAGTITSTLPTATWTAPAFDGDASITVRVRDSKGAMAAMTLNVSVREGSGRGKAAVEVSVNNWPEVDLVTASPTRIDVGESTQLEVETYDSDGDPLHYLWTADCDGSFSNPTAKNPAFTLASVGSSDSCALVMTVTDGRGGQNTGTMVINLGPAVPIQFAPVIDTAFQSRSSVDGNDTVVLRATAHDPNNSALTYAWSSTIGTLGAPDVSATGSEVVWTAPICLDGPLTVTLTVTDALGLQTTQTFDIAPARTCVQHSYWRFYELAVTEIHSPRSSELSWTTSDGIQIDPPHYHWNFDDFGAAFYDHQTNDIDEGWIASFAANGHGFVTSNFATPQSMTKFGVYSSYSGGDRGADWSIEWSDDDVAWHSVGTFHYTLRAVDSAGWYYFEWPESLNRP